jgi:hypothetical protein
MNSYITPSGFDFGGSFVFTIISTLRVFDYSWIKASIQIGLTELKDLA